jgi:hypothetical protein
MKSPPRRAAIAAAHPGLILALEQRFVGFTPTEDCWACGDEGTELERAHIVARAAGGTWDPSNFWLLCRQCHREQPDGASPEAQQLWLLSREPVLERFFRRFRETLQPLLDQALAAEYIEDRGEQLVEMLRSVAARVGWPTSFPASIRFELLADYRRWIERKPQPPTGDS